MKTVKNAESELDSKAQSTNSCPLKHPATSSSMTQNYT